MADDAAPGAPAPLELLRDDTVGYCDPVTGACELPGAASNAAEPEHPQPRDQASPREGPRAVRPLIEARTPLSSDPPHRSYAPAAPAPARRRQPHAGRSPA